jgi:hypothetical protein
MLHKNKHILYFVKYLVPATLCRGRPGEARLENFAKQSPRSQHLSSKHHRKEKALSGTAFHVALEGKGPGKGTFGGDKGSLPRIKRKPAG